MIECSDLESALLHISAYEIQTQSRFVSYKTTKHFGKTSVSTAKKVFWGDQGSVIIGRQEFSGIPFVVLGQKILECEFGKDRKARKKERKREGKPAEDNAVKKFRYKDSKKLECPARCVLRELCRFPSYQVPKDFTSCHLRRTADDLLCRLRNGEDIKADRVIIVCLPDIDEHTCQTVVGSASCEIVETIHSAPFTSLEEAYIFVESHETDTQMKYVTRSVNGIHKQDVTSLKFHEIKWNYCCPKEGTKLVCDGIPFIIYGFETRYCKYGPTRNSQKTYPLQETNEIVEEENKDNTFDDREVEPLLEEKKYEKPLHRTKKRRIKRQATKLNCQAKIIIKTIMKFPEYAIDLENESQEASKESLAKKLKHEFNMHTQRYIRVYVHIFNNHNHKAVPDETKGRCTDIYVDKGCTKFSNHFAADDS